MGFFKTSKEDIFVDKLIELTRENKISWKPVDKERSRFVYENVTIENIELTISSTPTNVSSARISKLFDLVKTQYKENHKDFLNREIDNFLRKYK